jgi:hypothetical protein
MDNQNNNIYSNDNVNSDDFNAGDNINAINNVNADNDINAGNRINNSASDNRGNIGDLYGMNDLRRNAQPPIAFSAAKYAISLFKVPFLSLAFSTVRLRLPGLLPKAL